MINVLYIEDSAVNAYIVEKMLKSLGYQPLLAYNGAAGIALAESHQPNLILIDLNLPDIHGVEVIKHLRRSLQLQNTSIIALTGNDSDDMEAECLKIGCQDYIKKPVSRPRLIDSINKHLGILV